MYRAPVLWPLTETIVWRATKARSWLTSACGRDGW
jgi:hypothetical protein